MQGKCLYSRVVRASFFWGTGEKKGEEGKRDEWNKWDKGENKDKGVKKAKKMRLSEK